MGSVIERSIPIDLVGVAQLSVSGNSSCWTNAVSLNCKKRLVTFPTPAGMSLTKLSLGENTVILGREYSAKGKTNRLVQNLVSYTLAH